MHRFLGFLHLLLLLLLFLVLLFVFLSSYNTIIYIPSCPICGDVRVTKGGRKMRVKAEEDKEEVELEEGENMKAKGRNREEGI